MTGTRYKQIINKVKARKVDQKSQLLSATGIYYSGGIRNRIRALDWIGINTTGRFYFDVSKVYFEKEIDATIFSLGYKP